MSALHIRWMIRRDLQDAVLEIEKSKRWEGEWSEHDFVLHLRQRSTIGMVVELKEKVVGFVVYDLGKTDLSILNIGVHVDVDLGWIAGAILERLKQKISYDNRRSGIKANVDGRDTALNDVLRSAGFKATRIQRTSDPIKGEMVISMAYRIPPAV